MYKYVFLLLLLFPLTTQATLITKVDVVEKEGKKTLNYPVTFALPFVKGNVTDGVKVIYRGIELTTQFDIKRTWADGSVKHGIISVVIPQVDADGTETLSIETSEANSSSGAMDKSAILATDVESEVELTNISGSTNPTSATLSLRAAINSDDLEYWMQGPICTEIIESANVGTVGNLNAQWEARFYPATSFGIRVSTIMEGVNFAHLGTTEYDIALNYGYSSPSEVFSFTNFSHSYGSRWRKTFWIGIEPPEIELHYDTDYLSSSHLIPFYDTTIIPDATEVSDLIYRYNNKSTPSALYPDGILGGSEIDGAGNFLRSFPTPGGRPELGILPAWDVMYLLTYDNALRELSLGNGNIAGQVASMHYRESDVTKSAYGHPFISIDDRPDVRLSVPSASGIKALGDISNNPDSWNPDRAHQMAFAYLPYIITGEHYYAEELSYWASWGIGYNSWARNGNGDSFDFSSSFPDGLSTGIIHDETRAVTWSMRNISNAVNILPDDWTTERAYFKEKLNNNLDWLAMANTGGTSSVKPLIVSYIIPHNDTGDPTTNVNYIHAPWQNDFFNIVLSMMIRQEESINNLSQAHTLRNRIAEYTIGRFSNDPDFSKWNGLGYWWPLHTISPDDWVNGMSWSDYNTLVLDHVDDTTLVQDSSFPRTDFDTMDNDGEGYLYIAKAALAQDTDLTNGSTAYDFLNSEMDSVQVAASPQWGAIVPPTGYTPPICSTTPSVCTGQTECEMAGWNWCNTYCNENECKSINIINIKQLY